jgi:hypothetical protein
MRKLMLLVSIASLFLLSNSLTEQADTPDARGRLVQQVVTLVLDVEDAPWMQPEDSAVEISAVDGWTTILNEDFEGPFPGDWIVFDNEPGSGEYFWAKRDCRAYGGRYSGWAVGGGADGSRLACGADYPDDAHAAMIYGPFSLADATAADWSFQLWLDSERGFDQLVYMVSTDGRSFSGPAISGDSNGWSAETLDLADVPQVGDLTGESQVWVALAFTTDSSINEPEGAHVDDIVIRKYVGSGPPSTPTPTATRTRTPTPTRTATRLATPTATPPGPAHFTYLPLVLKDLYRQGQMPTPTATATTRPLASPTPTLPAGEDTYVGTTDQGQRIELRVRSDHSAVTWLKLELSVSCNGNRKSGTVTISSRYGWDITNRAFQLESECNFDLSGTFDPSWRNISGTWQGIICEPFGFPRDEICRGPIGQWSAVRQ